jgi:carboxylesterase
MQTIEAAMQQPTIRNPHLEGDSFYWPGSTTGVLLLHGFTATTAEVRLLAQTLHQNGYTVNGPLLPGHGTRPAEMNRCRWQDWVAAAESAYRDLAARCQVLFVGGESMGGRLALYLASEHPEIAGVMTFAPGLRITSRLLPLIARIVAPLVQTVPKGASAPSPADDRWQGYPVNPVPAAVQLFRLQRQVRRRLTRVRQPLLVVQGRRDTSVHPSVPEILAREVSSAVKEVHWLEQSGHCVILDGEWETAAALTVQFVERVLRSDMPGDNT